MNIHSFSLVMNFQKRSRDLRSTPRGLKCIVCRSFPACLPEMSVRWRRQQRLVSRLCLPDHWALFQTHLADGRVGWDTNRRGVVGTMGGTVSTPSCCLRPTPPRHILRTHTEALWGSWLSLGLPLWVRNICGASLLGTNQTKKILLPPSFCPNTAQAFLPYTLLLFPEAGGMRLYQPAIGVLPFWSVERSIQVCQSCCETSSHMLVTCGPWLWK